MSARLGIRTPPTKAEIAAASHSFGLPWLWQPVSPAKYREKNLLGTIIQQTWDRAAAERG